MKNLIGILALGLLMSCGKKDQSETEVETLNYPFTKEGTLTLKDASGNVLKIIDLEIADNNIERQRGLMDRDTLLENQGMIFIDDAVVKQTFYMKNTRFPLDLVYISPDSTVVDIQQGVPYNEATIPSDTVSQYVLELNKGMAEKWGIKENETKVSWKAN